MKRTLAVSLLLALAAPAVQAQDVDAPAETPDVLTSLGEAFDATLCGKSWFSYSFNEQSAGSYGVTVEKAPAKSAPAVYRAIVEGEVSFGANSFRGREEFLLDGSLALLSRVAQEEKGSPDGKKVRKLDLGRVEGGWTYLEVKGERRTRKLSTFQGKNHWDPMCLVLLARKLSGHAPVKFELRGLDWSHAQGKDVALPAVLSAPADFEHRGETVQAQKLTVTRPGKDTTILQVDASGRLLAWWPEGSPLRLVAGTEAQVRGLDERDLTSTGAETPLSSVLVYFEVLSKLKPTTALDEVMDWSEVRREMIVESPEVEVMTVGMLAQLMKDQFERAPAALTKEQITELRLTLITKRDGDTATVCAPGREDDPFRLAKQGDAWRITHFPH